MNKVLFLISHLGSGYEHLFNVLDENPKIRGYDDEFIFKHPDDLYDFARDDAICMTPSLHNHTFNGNLCQYDQLCKFIYIIGPSHCLNLIEYAPQKALDYYEFRLARICQLANSTPQAVFLTWDDMVRGKGFDLIEEYLGLDTPIARKAVNFSFEEKVPLALVDKGQEVYGKYLQKLKSMDLKMVF
jgi:hypothetical protein